MNERSIRLIIFKTKKLDVFIVLSLTLLNAVFNGISIGILLPLFEFIISDNGNSKTINAILPDFYDYTIQKKYIYFSVIIILLFLCKSLFAMMKVYYSKNFSQSLRVDWVNKIGIYYAINSNKKAEQRKGELLNNWINETTIAARYFSSYLHYLSSLMISICLIVVGCMASLKLMAIFTITGIIVTTFSYYLMNKRMNYMGKQKLKLNQQLTGKAAEALNMIREIIVFNLKEFKINEITSYARKFKIVFIKINIFTELPKCCAELLVIVMLLGSLYISMVRFEMEAVQILPLIVLYTGIFYKLSIYISEAFAMRMKATSDFKSLQLVNELTNESENLNEVENAIEIPKNFDKIQFNKLHFMYGNQKVFENFSCDIKIGQINNIIGKSGVGKSTMIDLLLGIIKPQTGDININGVSINKITNHKWLRLFGYVGQDALLFNASILENMTLNNDQINISTVKKVAKICCIDTFIDSLNHGYETRVSDNGDSVSGGQRKRICVARALLRNPRILILDEVTTSFEKHLEKILYNNIIKNYPNITIINISHRSEYEAKNNNNIYLNKNK